LIFTPSTSYQSTPTSSRVLHPGLLLTSFHALSSLSYILQLPPSGLHRFSHHPDSRALPSIIPLRYPINHTPALSCPSDRTVSHILPIPTLSHPSYPCALLSVSYLSTLDAASNILPRSLIHQLPPNTYNDRPKVSRQPPILTRVTINFHLIASQPQTLRYRHINMRLICEYLVLLFNI
jgi:hypothetical protein